eukprot:2067770-Pleurochrysis_carterae.AAC.1
MQFRTDFSQSQGSLLEKGGESKAEGLACVGVFSKLKLKAVNHKSTKIIKRQIKSHFNQASVAREESTLKL